MIRQIWILSLVPAICLASSAFAQGADAPPSAEEQARQLDARRRKLDREVRYELLKQLSQIKKALAKDPALAEASAALESAQKAYDRKLKTDPDIVAAAKAKDAASEARAKVTAEVAAADPNVAAGQQELKAQYTREGEAEKVRKAASKELSAVRSRLARSAELKAAADRVAAADRTLRSLPETSAEIGAAYKAYSDARKACDAKARTLPAYQAVKDATKAYDDARHALPEYKASKEADKAYSALAKDAPGRDAARAQRDAARKAYDAKRRALPEYKAVDAAEEAYNRTRRALPEYKAYKDADAAYRELLKTSPAAQAAQAARDEARKAFDEALKAALATNAEAAPLLEKVKKAAADIADARKKRSEIRSRIRAAERAATADNPKIGEARKAYDVVRKTYYEALASKTAAEKKALDAANDAFNEQLDAKVAADAKAAGILQQIKEVEAKIKEMRDKARGLRKSR